MNTVLDVLRIIIMLTGVTATGLSCRDVLLCLSLAAVTTTAMIGVAELKEHLKA